MCLLCKDSVWCLWNLLDLLQPPKNLSTCIQNLLCAELLGSTLTKTISARKSQGGTSWSTTLSHTFFQSTLKYRASDAGVSKRGHRLNVPEAHQKWLSQDYRDDSKTKKHLTESSAWDFFLLKELKFLQILYIVLIFDLKRYWITWANWENKAKGQCSWEAQAQAHFVLNSKI